MAKFCKSINILLLIILLIISLITIGLGGWLLFEEQWILEIFGPNCVKTLGWVVVTTGIILFITTILGFCGIIKKYKACTLTYLIVVVIGFIIFAVAASLLFVYQKNVHDFLGHQVLTKFIDKYGPDDGFTQSWDEIQSSMFCCGFNDAGEYKSTRWYNKSDHIEGNVPTSCCVRHQNGSYVDIDKCTKDSPPTKSKYIYNDGCRIKLNEKIGKVAWFVAIILFAFCGIMLLVTVSACFMCRIISREVSYGQVV